MNEKREGWRQKHWTLYHPSVFIIRKLGLRGLGVTSYPPAWRAFLGAWQELRHGALIQAIRRLTPTLISSAAKGEHGGLVSGNRNRSVNLPGGYAGTLLFDYCLYEFV